MSLQGLEGSKNIVIFSSGVNVGSNVFSIFGRSTYETNESLVEVEVSMRTRFLSVSINVGTNGKSGNTTVSIRKNGVDIPESQIVIPPNTTGKFSIPILDDVIFDEGDILVIHFEALGGGAMSNLTYAAIILLS